MDPCLLNPTSGDHAAFPIYVFDRHSVALCPSLSGAEGHESPLSYEWEHIAHGSGGDGRFAVLTERSDV
jgi:hypothetical protein